MRHLSRFIEEIPLGEIVNPHTKRRERLTEMVTVCPACNSLRSLQHDRDIVHCTHCYWSTAINEKSNVA